VSVQDEKEKIVYKGKIDSPDKMQGNVDLAGGSGNWTGVKQ